MAYDPSPVDPAAFKADPNGACLDLATRMCQSLFRTVFSLPSESAAPDPGRVAHLPAPTTRLPREKPLPKPRPPTKWEVFAQRKGITKEKRSKAVYDETTGEWKRRYGYKRADDPNEIAVIDARPGDEPGMDPFAEMGKEKKDRVRKNKENQLKNLKNAAKVGGKGALPSTIALTTGLEDSKRKEKRKHLKDDIKQAGLVSGVSTASMGKFDRLLPGERPEERQLVQRRKKRLPVADRSGSEKHAVSNIVGRIVRERADDIFDTGKAVSRLEKETREKKAKAKVDAVRNGGVEKKKGDRFGKGPKKASAGKAVRKGGAKPSKQAVRNKGQKGRK